MNTNCITKNSTAKDKAAKIARALIKYHQGYPTPVSRQEDPYRVLVSCIISQRTRDEQTEKTSGKLFELASTPAEMLKLGRKKLEKVLSGAGFYRNKAKNIINSSRVILEKYGGKVPQAFDRLMELPGVGRKTANIVLVFGFNTPAIPVDTHVHRISNRLGLVGTGKPEETEFALARILPRRCWLPLNAVMVRHGRTICKPRRPLCRKCPVASLCHYGRADR